MSKTDDRQRHADVARLAKAFHDADDAWIENQRQICILQEKAGRLFAARKWTAADSLGDLAHAD